MPRITAERREARRTAILAAARRCFSRDGFHQTSMPDIAAEAGLSAGASYRYFASKEDLIVEIAGQAFGAMFEPVERLLESSRPTVADLVAATVGPLGGDTTRDVDGEAIAVEELLRCGVQAWAELLRHERLRERAQAGFDRLRERMAAALRRGQAAGTVSSDLDPDRSTRVVMALLHGHIVQRTAFGLTDTEAFVSEVRLMLADLAIVDDE